MTAAENTSAQRVAAGLVARDELARRRLLDFESLVYPAGRAHAAHYLGVEQGIANRSVHN
jgi:hypothetical protein